MQRRSFFSELKRRNVFRAALLYIGSIWALAQGIASLGPALGAPDWLTKWFVVAAAIGFPIWLMFAWFYELTPEGLKREREVGPDESITNQTARKLDIATIVALAVAIVLLLTDWFVLRPERPAQSAQVAQPAQAAAMPEKSIAVLPFANTSGDPANEYFSDGMSEELINTLGRLQDLTVIGRSSSFQFKGKGEDAKSVGAKLGVAYLLEGSVRKAEQKVRIAVELVNAKNGASVWSETYDRDLKDIFAVQSDIATQVASKLQSTLLANSGGAVARELKPDSPPSGSVEAYNALLQGNFYFGRRTTEDVQRAIELYREAARLDPRYALALARLVYARTELDASFAPTRGDVRRELRGELRDALATADELDPESPEVPLARGYTIETFDLDVPGAVREYRRSLKIAPQNPAVEFRLAAIEGYIGEFDTSIAGFRRVLALDPLSARAHLYLAIALSRIERYAEAEAGVRKAIELQPQAAVSHAYLATLLILQGRNPDSLAAAKQEPDEFWRNWALAFAYWANGDHPASDQALQWLIEHDADDAGSQIAQVYAQRGQADETFRWLEHAFDKNDGGLQQMRLSPFLTKFEKDPRYVEIARKVRVWPGSEPAAATSPPSQPPT